MVARPAAGVLLLLVCCASRVVISGTVSADNSGSLAPAQQEPNCTRFDTGGLARSSFIFNNI